MLLSSKHFIQFEMNFKFKKQSIHISAEYLCTEFRLTSGHTIFHVSRFFDVSSWCCLTLTADTYISYISASACAVLIIQCVFLTVLHGYVLQK